MIKSIDAFSSSYPFSPKHLGDMTTLLHNYINSDKTTYLDQFLPPGDHKIQIYKSGTIIIDLGNRQIQIYGKSGEKGINSVLNDMMKKNCPQIYTHDEPSRDYQKPTPQIQEAEVDDDAESPKEEKPRSWLRTAAKTAAMVTVGLGVGLAAHALMSAPGTSDQCPAPGPVCPVPGPGQCGIDSSTDGTSVFSEWFGSSNSSSSAVPPQASTATSTAHRDECPVPSTNGNSTLGERFGSSTAADAPIGDQGASLAGGPLPIFGPAQQSAAPVPPLIPIALGEHAANSTTRVQTHPPKPSSESWWIWDIIKGAWIRSREDEATQIAKAACRETSTTVGRTITNGVGHSLGNTTLSETPLFDIDQDAEFCSLSDDDEFLTPKSRSRSGSPFEEGDYCLEDGIVHRVTTVIGNAWDEAQGPPTLAGSPTFPVPNGKGTPGALETLVNAFEGTRTLTS